jgi:hypothetical protein
VIEFDIAISNSSLLLIANVNFMKSVIKERQKQMWLRNRPDGITLVKYVLHKIRRFPCCSLLESLEMSYIFPQPPLLLLANSE